MYIACTFDTVYTVDTVDILCTVDMLYTATMVYTQFVISKISTNRPKTRCQILCTNELHRDPISKVLSEW